MTVFPRYWALAEFPLPGRTGPDIASVPRPDRNGLEGAGVREFRAGDSLRHVHWRSTARRGTLVVREFEHEAADAVALLIDTRAEVYAADRSGQAFEDLVQAAASIVHTVTQSGRPVELIGARGTQVSTAVVGWSQALHWLARVQPHGMRSPLAAYRSAAVSETPAGIRTPARDAPAALAQQGVPVAAVPVGVAPSWGPPPSG